DLYDLGDEGSDWSSEEDEDDKDDEEEEDEDDEGDSGKVQDAKAQEEEKAYVPSLVDSCVAVIACTIDYWDGCGLATSRMHWFNLGHRIVLARRLIPEPLTTTALESLQRAFPRHMREHNGHLVVRRNVGDDLFRHFEPSREPVRTSGYLGGPVSSAVGAMLRMLDLSGTNFDDGMGMALRFLTQLEVLDVSGTKITDVGLSNIIRPTRYDRTQGLISLTHLNLSYNANIADAAILVKISAVLGKLAVLDVSFTSVAMSVGLGAQLGRTGWMKLPVRVRIFDRDSYVPKFQAGSEWTRIRLGSTPTNASGQSEGVGTDRSTDKSDDENLECEEGHPVFDGLSTEIKELLKRPRENSRAANSKNDVWNHIFLPRDQRTQNKYWSHIAKTINNPKSSLYKNKSTFPEIPSFDDGMDLSKTNISLAFKRVEEFLQHRWRMRLASAKDKTRWEIWGCKFVRVGSPSPMPAPGVQMGIKLKTGTEVHRQHQVIQKPTAVISRKNNEENARGGGAPQWTSSSTAPATQRLTDGRSAPPKASNDRSHVPVQIKRRDTDGNMQEEESQSTQLVTKKPRSVFPFSMSASQPSSSKSSSGGGSIPLKRPLLGIQQQQPRVQPVGAGKGRGMIGGGVWDSLAEFAAEGPSKRQKEETTKQMDGPPTSSHFGPGAAAGEHASSPGVSRGRSNNSGGGGGGGLLRRTTTIVKLLRTKNVGLLGGMTLLINSMTGPGVPQTQYLFQQTGWLPVVLCFIIYSVIASLSALFIVEAMQAVPGNKHFQGTVEFGTLINFYFGKWAHIVGQCMLYAALQSTAIASIIQVAQTADFILMDLNGRTCAFAISPFRGWFCVDQTTAAQNSVSPFGDTYILFSIGFLIILFIVVPLGAINLDDNIYLQIGEYPTLLL
ncbi:hypothetical protein HK102_007408, partial [Quaeritorhiza haematococci]